VKPILFYSSLVLYLSAGIFYLLQLVFENPTPGKLAARLTFLAWLVQTVMLGIHFSKVGYPFLVDSSSSYAFSAWVTALVFLLLNLKYRFQVIGMVALPLISVFFLLSLFSSESYASHATTLTHSPWASIHIIFSFLALALFSLSFILAIIFIIEEFQLKYKVLPKIVLRLPSLQVVEQIHAKSLTVGFALLTGGIISGVAWAKSVTGVYFFEDARQLWAICAWLIYAFFLQARFAAGWRGRKGILLSILGFVVILFTFLGVQHS